jgi:thioredoxin 1
MAHESNDATFEQDVLKADGPVLVDFWAEWCGPCKQIGPIVEGLSSDMAGRLKVVKVNIDHSPETPQKYGVRGIPTLIIFKDGKPSATKVGSIPKSALYEWVESVIAA